MVDVRTNLLKKRQVLSEKDYQKERDYLKWSMIGFVVVVVLTVSFSAWNFFLSRKLSGIETAITKTSTELQGLSQASAQQVYLKSRLQLVTGFLANRTVTRDSLQKIFSTDIPGTHVSGVSFESESAIGVQYLADSSGAFSSLLDYYQADTGYFTQAISNGVSLTKDGNYQMSLVLTLPVGDK